MAFSLLSAIGSVAKSELMKKLVTVAQITQNNGNAGRHSSSGSRTASNGVSTPEIKVGGIE